MILRRHAYSLAPAPAPDKQNFPVRINRRATIDFQAVAGEIFRNDVR